MGNYSKIDDGGLWELISQHQGEQFSTSGRGRFPGKPFTYTIKGGEMFISNKEKSITKATVMVAYKRALELQATEGCVSGPKRLNVPGAGSYIWPVFLHLGIITRTPMCV